MTDIQAADKILEYICRPENKQNHFTSEELQEQLFPGEALEMVEHCFTIIELQIQNFRPEIAKYVDYYLSANGFTKVFLGKGGLTGIEESRLQKTSKEQDEKKLQIEKLNLEVVKLRNDFFDYEDTRKRAKQSILISKISVIIAAVALSVTLVKWKCGA